jgi:hypothetical protein
VSTASSPRDSTAETPCPVCGKLVNVLGINGHLDSQCTLSKVFRSPKPPIKRARSLPSSATPREEIDLTAPDDLEEASSCDLDSQCRDHGGAAASRQGAAEPLAPANGMISHESLESVVGGTGSRSGKGALGGRCDSPACESDISIADSEVSLPLVSAALASPDNEGA